MGAGVAATAARVFLAILAALTVLSGSARAATPGAPVASCYDLISFDGLDARYTANHCAAATAQAGYAATSYHNTDARSAAARAVADGVFYSAGHALLDQDSAGNTTAAMLLFEYPGPAQNADGLLGDSFTSYDIQASSGICDDTGSCHEYATPIVAYPWADNLPAQFKLNLAVLQSCQTARSGSAFTDMTTLVNQNGAGTAIGFRDDVSFPVNAPESNLYGSAWANRFWADLAGGASYAAATVDASNAVGNAYGYGSYVVQHTPGAPNSLYPAQYYLSYDGSSATAVRSAAASPSGSIVRAHDAVYAAQLAARGSRAVAKAAARATARRFALAHVQDLAAYERRTAVFEDHGSFKSYRFVWQMRRGKAWLPASVTVGINATTGAVAFYHVNQKRYDGPTSPRVTAAQARTAALRVAGIPPQWARVRAPRLELIRANGRFRLVWITEIRGTGASASLGSRRVSLPTYRVMWTDARTGATTLSASS
jgi:hypothetical protein